MAVMFELPWGPLKVAAVLELQPAQCSRSIPVTAPKFEIPQHPLSAGQMII